MPSQQASSDSLEYEIVDVFAERAFAGNPLAVVYGADGLDDDAAAGDRPRVQPVGDDVPVAMTDDDRAAGADYRVRIFTPATELPFAGHPTLGTAWALARRGVVEPGDERVQSCGAGLIGLRIPADETEAVELSATPRDHARRAQRRRDSRAGGVGEPWS